MCAPSDKGDLAKSGIPDLTDNVRSVHSSLSQHLIHNTNDANAWREEGKKEGKREGKKGSGKKDIGGDDTVVSSIWNKDLLPIKCWLAEACHSKPDRK